jgi:hypothetical protein
MGAAGMTPGGRDREARAASGRQRDGRLPVCNRPTRVGMKDKDSHGQQVKVRVCKRADCGEEIDR